MCCANFCSTTWPEKVPVQCLDLDWEYCGHSWKCTFDPWPRLASRIEVPLMFIFHFHDSFVLFFFLVGLGFHPQSERSTPMFLLEPWRQLFFGGGGSRESRHI